MKLLSLAGHTRRNTPCVQCEGLNVWTLSTLREKWRSQRQSVNQDTSLRVKKNRIVSKGQSLCWEWGVPQFWDETAVCTLRAYLVWSQFTLLCSADTAVFTDWRSVATLCQGSLSAPLFPRIYTRFMSPCHTLVILAIFQTLCYYTCYGDLWSVIMTCWNLR